ncbi:HutD family protein [Streptomyces sp. H10-C2]|uniref:HutD/Ves family protein n=1 Tax=unclassified Streptomyces TaxID=2593676 RepID=UPI0024BA1EC8|nr:MULTISPECIES: HutD family protein [unclassified Streptomyces]MDJ0343571.1 HutD family protein [Streptomyces sp. PH10-H1]MDJ0368853.1 HutD family protein [Streptomyces sp. H10-C2]
METRILRARDRTPTPWSNGGGVTREIAAGPADTGAGAGAGAGAGIRTGAGADMSTATTGFGWRVSLADVVEDGPYSAFPGVDRIITVVDGAGMVLTIDGVTHAPTLPLRPLAFPGDAATGCRLTGGPIVNLNVMTRRGRAAATVEIVEGPHTATVPEDGAVLLVALTDDAAIGPEGGSLGRFDAALATGGGSGSGTDSGTGGALTLRPGGRAAVITIRTIGTSSANRPVDNEV